MPELPEVEVTRQALAPWVEGRTVRAVTVREPRLRWPVPPRLPRLLAGHEVLRLERRGKYLLWRFAHGTLISHLGMSGVWRVHPLRAPPAGRHDHVDLRIGGACLRLTDPRRIGALLGQPAGSGALDDHPLLARLGIEPVDPRFDGAWLYRHTRGRVAAIKLVLLAGEAVVGVGNIYASESLFRAGIRPTLPSHRLSRPRCDRLADAIRATLAQSGAAIVILPPLSASVTADGQRNPLLRAAVAIRVMVNTQANADTEEGYNVDALKIVGKVCEALMTAECSNPDEKFDFAATPVRLLEEANGLLVYQVEFTVPAELYMGEDETT
jgi:formamidopyrimidine-DNA glycosylase